MDSITGAVSDAATNASAAVNKVVSNATAVVSNGINAATAKADEIAKLAQSGVSNLSTSINSIAAGQASAAVGAASNAASNLVSLGNISGFKSSEITKINIPSKPPFSNILHNYASYNYITTLSIIPPESYNSPDSSYKAGDLGQIIFRSGSGQPNNRISTEYGKYDFYMEDLHVTGLVKSNRETGNTESVTAKFKVIEPYSMGLFFQAIEVAASMCGYSVYTEATYLLTIEFIGHISGDMQGVSADAMAIEKTTRHFTIMMSNINMSVTGKGAVYEIEGLMYNHSAFSSSNATLKTDISIAGSTVQEILQTGDKSLQKVLSDRLIEAAKRENKTPDQILIYFPIDPKTGDGSSGSEEKTATASSTASSSISAKLKLTQGKNSTLVQADSTVNALGSASMAYDFFRPADQPFSKDNAVFNPTTKINDRSKVTNPPNVGEMRFAQDTNIVTIINEALIASDYCRQALAPAQITKTNKVIWWKVEPQVFLLPGDNIARTGSIPKLTVYRVVPYGMDAAVLLPPNANNTKIGGVREQALKEYNYIYTSKNLDVITFNIQFQAGFYKSTSADLGQNSDSVEKQKSQSNTPGDTYAAPKPADDGKEPTANNPPTKVIADNTKTSSGNRGGTGIDTPAVIAARRAHDMFLNSMDMTNLEMTILGDPYFLGDSGVGNYVAAESTLENMNADHAMNTQNGDVHIIVNFRTPLDIDASEGSYKFGPTKLVNAFSGVYIVVEVESVFNRGRFTQNLKLMRVQGQSGFDGTIVDSSELPKSIVPPNAVPAADPGDVSKEAPTAPTD